MNQKISKYRFILYLCSILTLVGSCNFSGKLTRRYKEVVYAPDNACHITDYVTVHASVPSKDPAPPPATIALNDLDAEGQKALIKELSAKEPTSDGLLAKLRSDLAIPPDRSVSKLLDMTKINKRILTAIQKVPIQEGERIEKVIVQLTVNDPNLVFRNCNKIVTEYMNVDLGKLTYSNTNAFELSGSLGSGSERNSSRSVTNDNTSSSSSEDKTLGSDRATSNGLTNKLTSSTGLNGKFNASRSFNEEVQLRQRLVALNAFITNNQLFLYQEGISGIDLSGNIITDISAEYLNNIRVDKVYSIDKLFNAAGAAGPQSGIQFSSTLIKSPNIAADITATVRFQAVYRKITSGDKTITESDDKIQLIQGATYGAACTGETFVLVPATSLRPNMWKLTYSIGVAAHPRLPLHVVNGTGMGGDLLFSSYENAIDFLRWLKAGAQGGSINTTNAMGGVYLLRQGDNVTPLTAAQIQSLDIELN